MAPAHHVPLGIGALHHIARRVHAQGRGRWCVGQVRAGQIGRSTQHLRQAGGEMLQRNLRGFARGHGVALGISSHHGIDRGLDKVFRQLALHAALQFLGQCGVRSFVRSKALVPGLFARAAGRFGVPGCVHVFGNDEGGMRPAQGFAGELDLFRAKWLAVGFGGIGAVGAAFANRCFADD